MTKGKLCLLLFLIPLLSIELWGKNLPLVYVTGPTSVCPNQAYAYTVHNSCPNVNSVSWNVTGGFISGGGDPPIESVLPANNNNARVASLTTETVWITWTSMGAKFLTVATGSIDPGCDIGGLIGGAVNFIVPSLTAPAPATISLTINNQPSNNFCPGNIVTVTSSSVGASVAYTFEYSLDGGSYSFLPSTDGIATFTVPSNLSPTVHQYVFRVSTRYIDCYNTQSTYTYSGPANVYNPPPSLTITSQDKICTNTSTGGLVLTSISTPYEYVIVNYTGGNVTISSALLNNYLLNLPPGSYSVQVKNYSVSSQVDQCYNEYGPFSVSTTNTPISVAPNVTSNYNGRAVSCLDAADGQVTLTPSGGTAPFTFNKNSGSFDSNNIFAGLSPGSHTFGIKDVNGCTNTASLTVSNTPDLVLSSPGTSNYNGWGVSCSGGNNGQVFLSSAPTGGTGSYSYVWKNATNTTVGTSATLSSAGVGDYKVIVTDANGCSKISSTVSLSAPGPLTISSITSTNPICSGQANGTITVNGAGGGTGAIVYSLDGTNFQPTNIFNAKAAGTYPVSLKDANGCVGNVGTASLTNPPAILVTNQIVSPGCFGENNGSITVTASNGTAPYTYSKNGGGSFQISNVFNTGISSGTYSIVAKDANNCQNSPATVNVTQPSAVGGNISSPSNFSCYNTSNSAGLNLTPTGGTPGYTFSWNTGATTEDISVTLGTSLSSTYSVTITDSKGCTSSRSVTLTQPPQLASSVSITNITCFGMSNGSVDVTPTGGTSPYTYLWNTGGTTQDLSSKSAGIYTAVITDANNCTANVSATITEPSKLVLSPGVINPVACYGQSNGSANLIATGGTSPYSYSKDGTTWQSTSLITGLAEGNYTMHLRDQNLCTAQIIVAVTQPSVLNLTVNNIQDAACGQFNGSAQSVGSGGTGTYNYEWKNAANQIVSTSSSLTNVSGGAYKVTITDQKGCSEFKNVAIGSSNGPQVTVNSITGTSCSNSSDGKAIISISSGQPPYTITWNNGENGLSVVKLKPGTGTNIVTITDMANCTLAKIIDVPSPPVLKVSASDILQPTCPGGADGSAKAIVEGGTAPYFYLWSTGSTSSSLTSAGAGSYQVTATDTKNCIAEFSVKIEDKPAIVITVSDKKLASCTDKADGRIEVGAEGGNGSFSYLWNTGATSYALSNIMAGTYTVTATDALGCSSQSRVTLPETPPFTLDLGPDKEICKGGTFTISSPVEGASYQWSSANGFSSTSKQVLLTQPGNYKLKVTSTKGCNAEDSFTLITSTNLLKADFLVTPVAHVGDTIIAIDISWPLPENITWILPGAATIVQQTQDFALLTFNTEGLFPIKLMANLAQCQSEYVATVKILKKENDKPGGRIAKEIIQSVQVFPNPTSDGRISARIELSENAPVRTRLISPTNNIVKDFSDDGKDLYEYEIKLEGITRGTYFLVVEVREERRVIRIVVI